MYQLKEKKQNLFLGLFIFFVILMNTSVGPYLNVQSITLFILIPILFILAFLKDINSFQNGTREYLIYFLIVCLSLTTIYYYVNFNGFESGFKTLIAALLAAYIPIGINKNGNYYLYFHLGFIISMIFLIYIEYTLGNFQLIGFSSLKGSRGRFYFNANYYSYISYFANFSLFYLHLKYKNKITLTCLLLFPLVLLVLSFITQSRSGLLLILFINTCYWFLILKNDPANKILKIGRQFLLILITVVAVFQLLKIYNNSQIKTRISNSAEDSRGVLAVEGIKVFANNPFIGVGLGQFPNYSRYNQFTHNSYTEILAEQGILGGILLLLLFGIPLIKSIKLLQNNKNNALLRLNFLFFITFLLYNNAYVFYKFSFSMMYFFLIISIQNNFSTKSTKALL